MHGWTRCDGPFADAALCWLGEWRVECMQPAKQPSQSIRPAHAMLAHTTGQRAPPPAMRGAQVAAAAAPPSLLPSILLSLLLLLVFLSSLSSVVAQQFGLTVDGCICSIGAVDTSTAGARAAAAAAGGRDPWPVDGVTPASAQTAQEMTNGIPSLAALQQHDLQALLAERYNGSSAGAALDPDPAAMDALRAAFPQLQGGPISCNRVCDVHRYAPNGLFVSTLGNRDFLTLSVGSKGQVCGVHAAGPYLVECVGPSGNGEISVPAGLQALSLASGEDATCAITLQRTLVCWGGLDSWGERTPPAEFTDGSHVVEQAVCRVQAACAIGHRRRDPDAASNDPNDIGSVLLCWGILGPGKPQELRIPTLQRGVRWVKVTLNSHSTSYGLGLDSEGRVWTLPPGGTPRIMAQSSLFPMVNIAMSDTVACGVQGGTLELLCWQTDMSRANQGRTTYDLEHNLPAPPPSSQLLAFQYSDIQCFRVACAGVAINLYNSIQAWGYKASTTNPVPLLADPAFVPRPAGVLRVELGYDFGCLLGLDGRMTCFSTDESIPFASGGEQDQLFIRDRYVTSNPFASAKTFGLELIPQMQFADVGVAKGLVSASPTYLVYLSSMSWVGCVFPYVPIPSNTSAIPSGGFYTGVFGPNAATPNFTQGATIKELSAAGGYYCTRDVEDRVACFNYQSEYQGIRIRSDNSDPRGGADTPYAALATGQGFYCLLRQVDRSLYCNNVTVTSSIGLEGSIDVRMDEWNLPQFSPLPSVRDAAWHSVAAGDVHACAIREHDLTVQCWGHYARYNRTRIGYSNVVLHTLYPALAAPPAPWSLEPFAVVAAGTRVSCGLLNATREAVCWGRCDARQCEVPVRSVEVPGPPVRPARPYSFRSISVGSDTVCAVTDDDARELVCWGGASAPPSSSPPFSPSAEPVPSVAAPLGGLQPAPSPVASLAPLNAYARGAEMLVCPQGTFSLGGGMHTSLCWGPCGAGGFGTATPLQATMAAGPGGATVQRSVCSAASSCPRGHYCPGGSAMPQACAAGRFGSTSGLVDSSCTASCIPGFYCPPGTPAATSYPCPAGRYGNATGLVSSECSGVCALGYYCLEAARTSEAYPCPNAGFICPEGSGEPVKVPDGYYSNSSLPAEVALNGTRMTDVYPCPPGSACIGGVAQLCQPGSANAESGASECDPCPVGHFAALPGSLHCVKCLTGTYTNATGRSSCDLCPSGQAQAVNGLSKCIVCTPGFYSLGGQTRCDRCPPHTYSPTDGAPTCAPCLPPLVVAKQRTQCVERSPCQAGYFLVVDPTPEQVRAGHNANDCAPCPPGSFSGLGTRGACTPCARGTYTLAPASEGCMACPSSGMECDGVSGLPRVHSGWWGWVDADNKTVHAAPCPPAFCPGPFVLLQPALAANRSAWAAAGIKAIVRKELAKQQSCGPNRDPSPSNALCGACSPGFVMWRGGCVSCPGVKVGLLVVFLLATFVLAGVLHVLSQRNNGDTAVLVYFVQAALLQLGTYDQWLSWLGLLNFNVSQVSGSTCIAPLTPYQHMAVQIMLPLLLLAQLLLLALMRAAYLSCKRKYGADVQFVENDDAQYAPQVRVRFADDQIVEHSVVSLEDKDDGGAAAAAVADDTSSDPVAHSFPATRSSKLHRLLPSSLRTHGGLGLDRGAFSFEMREGLLRQDQHAESDEAVFRSPSSASGGADVKTPMSPSAAGSMDAVSVEAQAEAEAPAATEEEEAEEAAKAAGSAVSPPVAAAAVPSSVSSQETLRTPFFPTSSASLVRTCVSLYLFSYQSCATACLHYLECVSVLSHRRVLFSAPSVDCDSAEYRRYLPLIWMLLVGAELAGPVLIGVVLFRRRHSLTASTPAAVRFRARFGSLFESYRPGAYLWPPVSQLRPLALASLAVALHEDRAALYMSFAFLNCAVLAAHVYAQPYVLRRDNLAATVSLQLLVLLSVALLAYQPPYGRTFQAALCLLVIPFVAVWTGAIVHTRVQRYLDGRRERQRLIKQIQRGRGK